MPVLVGNQVIKDDHLIDGVLNTGNTEGFTAIQVVAVYARLSEYNRARFWPARDECGNAKVASQ